MKRSLRVALTAGAIVAAILVAGAPAGLAQPANHTAAQAGVTTIITYQGRLTDADAPAHGSYDLTFSLYDALEGGSLVAGAIDCEDVAVKEGTFSVDLDFGEGIFDGQALFLEIGVRRGPSTGAYTTLSPRQSVRATPYALALPGLRTENLDAGAPNVVGGSRANSVATDIEGATVAGGGSATQPNQVSAGYGTVSGGLGNVASAETATVAGGENNAAGGTASIVLGGKDNHANGAYSLAAGRNAQATHHGTFVWADSTGAALSSSAGDQFLVRASGGVTFTTSSGAMLQLIPHVESPSLVAGYGGNIATAGVKGVSIVGGGASGSPNKATDDFSVVAGGASNQAGNNNSTISDAPYASVGGGKGNQATGRGAAVAGGEYNRATARDATVGGGYQNAAGGQDATIAGGRDNTAGGENATVAGGADNGADGLNSAVGGGTLNVASAQAATVGGGNANTASAGNSTVAGGNGNVSSNTYAFVGGGQENEASGTHSTVAGGTDNDASASSSTVAGGSTNTANNAYASVGGGQGNSASGTHSTVSGGHDNTASGADSTSPGGSGNQAEGDYSFAAGRQAVASHDGSFVWADSQEFDFSSGAVDDFSVRATGGVHLVTAIDALGNPTAGISLPAGGSSWGTPSDRNLKEHIAPIDGRDVLDRLADVPISQWNYRSQDAEIQHMGPMSQDFYAAFGLGEDELHIATVDADGVALAASQALYELVQEQDAQIAALEARLDALEAEMNQTPTQSSSTGLPAWLFVGATLMAGVIAGPRFLRGGRL